MAQIPNLDNAPLNLAALREQSQKDLLNILKSIRGEKCLVIDPKLAGTLSLILQTSLLKEYGAELRLLSADPLQTECPKIVYLVCSQLSFMKFIASQIKNDEPKGLQREYFLYFVPRRTVACEKILEEERVHQKLTLGEYPLYLVPLDEDVLSFELVHSLQLLIHQKMFSATFPVNVKEFVTDSFVGIPYQRHNKQRQDNVSHTES